MRAPLRLVCDRTRFLTLNRFEPALAKSRPATVPVLLPLALPAPYDYLVPKGMEVAPGQFVVAPLATVEYRGLGWPRGECGEAPKPDPRRPREIIEGGYDV